MTRNLKTLGLALMAALAFSAVAVSSASAQGTEEGLVALGNTEATLTGSQTGGEGANSFTAFGATIECPGSTYTGHKLNATPHQKVHSGETAITVTPHYKNCTTPVDMNGCDYVLRDFTTDGGNGTYDVLFDIVCPEEQAITMGSGFCDTTVPAQSGLSGLHSTNTPGDEETPKDHIDLTGTIEGITVSNHCLGGGTATEHVDLRIKGHNANGNETAVTVSDVPPPETEDGHLTSESTEATLTGFQTGGEGANSFTAFGSTVECPESTFTGHKVDVTEPKEPLHSGETEITVTPHYKNCTTPVDMNGCDYVLRDFTTDGGNGTYDVLFDIVCPPGLAITKGSGFCDTTIPPQSGLSGLRLTNTPGDEETPKDHIDLTGSIEGMAVSNHCFGEAVATEHLDLRIEGDDPEGSETGITVSEVEA